MQPERHACTGVDAAAGLPESERLIQLRARRRSHARASGSWTKPKDSPVNGTSATVFRLTDCP